VPSLPSLAEALAAALARQQAPSPAGDWDFGALGAEPPAAPIPAAVLMAVVERQEPTLILTRRTAHLRTHAGQIAFPGGRSDAEDGGPIPAALREAEEEIGLSKQLVQVVGLSDPYETGTGYRIAPVVGLVPPKLSLSPSRQEVAELFEAPLAHLLDRRQHQLREADWRGRRRQYYVIEWQGREIWGATAGMIVNLAARLG
jgi:8-oxo-dGTP pyrophosphatase MutT (NUDIX family)